MFCKKCGSSLSEDAMFCKKCGNKIAAKPAVVEASKSLSAPKPAELGKTCEKCGNTLAAGALFCKRCGNKIGEKAPVVENVAERIFKDEESKPQYGEPVAPVRKKRSLRKTLLIVAGGILAGSTLVFGTLFIGLFIWAINVPDTPTEIGNVQPSPAANAGGNTGGNAVGNTGGNAGDNTGGNTAPEPVKSQTYTSEKTGKTFTIPFEGYAQLSYDGGSPESVAAEYNSHEPNNNFKYTSFFNVNCCDPVEYISFNLTPKSGSWKTGDKLGHSELSSETDYIFIKVPTAYLGTILTGLLSKNKDLSGYFKDSEFKIIEADSSGKIVKFYFYTEYKVSGSSDSPYHTLEGVANVVRDAGAGSSGGSGGNTGGTGGDIGGGTGTTKCFTCDGKGSKDCPACDGGKVQCRSCNGNGTYYAYGEGIMKRCTNCSGNGSVNCTRSNCMGGRIECTDCGGDGIR